MLRLDHVKLSWLEFARFVVVGFATFLINLSLFYLFLKAFRYDYRISVSLAYFITVLCHFAANRSFTFRAGGQPIAHNAIRYVLMLGVNYSVALGSSWLVIEKWGLPPYVAVIMYGAGNALTSFLMMKHIVFSYGGSGK